MTSKRIALSGFPEVELRQDIKEDCTSIFFYKISGLNKILKDYNRSALRHLLDYLEDFDMWIIRFSGQNPMDLINLLRFHGLLRKYEKRSFLTLYWSMDSHHMWRMEKKAIPHFDRIMIAHPKYLSRFPPESVSIMLCANTVCSFSKAKALSEYLRRRKQSNDALGPSFAAYFKVYPGFYRNIEYLRIMKSLDEADISCSFAEITTEANQPEPYVFALAEADFIVNISLSGDFNMRNFEALSCGSVRCSKEDIGELDKNNEFKIDSRRGHSDAAAKFLKSFPEFRTYEIPQGLHEKFLKEHSLENRLLQMFEISASQAETNLELRDFSFTFQTSYKGVNIQPHSLASLLSNSPPHAIRTTNLNFLVQEEGFLGLSSFFLLLGYSLLKQLVWQLKKRFQIVSFFILMLRRLA